MKTAGRNRAGIARQGDFRQQEGDCSCGLTGAAPSSPQAPSKAVPPDDVVRLKSGRLTAEALGMEPAVALAKVTVPRRFTFRSSTCVTQNDNRIHANPRK